MKRFTLALGLALLGAVAFLCAQTPTLFDPAAPNCLNIVKIAGGEGSDPFWNHFHLGMAGMSSVTFQVTAYRCNDVPGAPIDVTGLQIQFVSRTIPWSPWLSPTGNSFTFTIDASDPVLAPLKDGVNDITLNIQGTNAIAFRPLLVYMHLWRGLDTVDAQGRYPSNPCVPILSRDNQPGNDIEDTGPNVDCVDVATRTFKGYPVDPSTSAFVGPPVAANLYQELMTPQVPQLRAAQMWWEEPQGTVSAGLKFVRGLLTKGFQADDFRFIDKTGLAPTATGWGGERNMPFKDGPRGVGWIDPYIQGQVDAKGGLINVSLGGPLRYLAPNGTLYTVAGWRVQASHDPVWVMKALTDIRANEELVGTWPAVGQGQDAADPGFHTPTDVTVCDADQNTWYVASYGDNMLWKVVVDRTTYVGTVTPFAGALDRSPGYADGQGSAARFYGPVSLACDPTTNTLVVSDEENDAIRRVDLQGNVTTIFGAPGMGARLQAAGAQGCAPDTLTGRIVCLGAANRALMQFVTTAGQKPDINVPHAIDVLSTGAIVIYEYGTQAIRECQVNGACMLLQDVASVPTPQNRPWVWVKCDRWGHSGQVDSCVLAESLQQSVPNATGSAIANETEVFIPAHGQGTPSYIFPAAANAPYGWGPLGETRSPHYAWLIVPIPAGGYYVTGIANHGVTRLRPAKPDDYVFPNVNALFNYYDADYVWQHSAARGIPFNTLPQDGLYRSISKAARFGYYGHNYLGLPDAWDPAVSGATDAQLISLYGLPAGQTSPQTLNALTDYIRQSGGVAPQHQAGPTPPTPTGDGATFVSQTVETTMIAGQAYPITLVYLNSGTTTWQASTGYQPCEVPNADGSNNAAFGPVCLALGADVPPNTQGIFTGTLIAPSIPGAYPMQWQFLQQNVHWFGEKSPALSIAVTPPPPTLIPFTLSCTFDPVTNTARCP